MDQTNAHAQTPTVGGDWLSSAEAADLMGVSRRTLADLRRDGVVPYHRHGQKVLRYRRADILGYLAAIRVEPVAAPNPLGRARRRRRAVA